MTFHGAPTPRGLNVSDNLMRELTDVRDYRFIRADHSDAFLIVVHRLGKRANENGASSVQ